MNICVRKVKAISLYIKTSRENLTTTPKLFHRAGEQTKTNICSLNQFTAVIDGSNWLLLPSKDDRDSWLL